MIGNEKVDFYENVRQLVAERQRRKTVSLEIEKRIPTGIRLGISFLGLRSASDCLEVKDAGVIFRNLKNPPDIAEFHRASFTHTISTSAAAAFASSLESELIASLKPTKENIDAVYYFAKILRLRMGSQFVVPMYCSSSWDLFYIQPDASIRVGVIEQPGGSHQPEAHVLTQRDLEWCVDRTISSIHLSHPSNSKRLSLALEIATRWHLESSGRAKLVNIWTALDALFGKREYGVARSISGRIADWVESMSRDEVAALYAIRSDAVHGREIDVKDLRTAEKASWKLLQESILLVLERERPPLADDE